MNIIQQTDTIIEEVRTNVNNIKNMGDLTKREELLVKMVEICIKTIIFLKDRVIETACRVQELKESIR